MTSSNLKWRTIAFDFLHPPSLRKIISTGNAPKTGAGLQAFPSRSSQLGLDQFLILQCSAPLRFSFYPFSSFTGILIKARFFRLRRSSQKQSARNIASGTATNSLPQCGTGEAGFIQG